MALAEALRAPDLTADPNAGPPHGTAAPTASLWRIGSLQSEGLCGLFAAGLLAAGFLGYVALAAAIATHDADPRTVGLTQRAFVVYARTLLVKGLLPQLGGTLVLFALVRRGSWSRGALRSGLSPVLSLGLCGALANVLVVSLLLGVDHPGMPAVKFVDALNRLRTGLEMTGAVVVAVVVARLVWRRWGGFGVAEEASRRA